VTQFARQLLAGLSAGVGIGLFSGVFTGGIVAIFMLITDAGRNQVALISDISRRSGRPATRPWRRCSRPTAWSSWSGPNI